MLNLVNRYFGFIALIIIFSFIGIGELVMAKWNMSVAPDREVVGANIAQGRILIQDYGCGTCHTIPGIGGANAMVGPSLVDFGARTFIAGELPNHPDNLIFFLQYPQLVNPDTDMPDLNITLEEAADIAAYLYTLQN